MEKFTDKMEVLMGAICLFSIIVIFSLSFILEKVEKYKRRPKEKKEDRYF